MKMRRSILIVTLMMLCVGICSAQTIRNSNNSVVAMVENDGTVRNSNNSIVAKISSNGDIRDSNNHLLGKIESDGVIRNSNNSYLGKVESNGVVRNSNNSTLGKVESDGTVRDSNNHTIGYAKGVPMRYAALYFFFNFFLSTIIFISFHSNKINNPTEFIFCTNWPFNWFSINT